MKSGNSQNYGGKREGAGRKKGSLTEAQLVARDLARKLAPQAFQVIAELMYKSDFDSTKLAAAKEILDRAYGKAPQSTEQKIIDDEGKAIQPIVISFGNVK